MPLRPRRLCLLVPAIAASLIAANGCQLSPAADPEPTETFPDGTTAQALTPADVPVPVASRSSVLLIVLDDVGMEAMDLYPAAYRVATTPPAVPVPNLRALAKKGVMFTNAWVNPSCSPTRAAIFTGRHAFRHGIGVAITPLADGTASKELPRTELGLPQAFNAGAPNAYALSHIGKWHLSGGVRDPNEYGWPYFAGPHPTTYGGIGNYYGWWKVRNGQTVSNPKYATVDQAEEAIARIQAAKAANKPYFISLQLSAAHAAYNKVPDELHPQIDGHSSLPYTTKATTNTRAYYEMMVESADKAIGNVLAHVDLTKTTVLFIADNGTAESVAASPLTSKRAKTSMYEGGVRVPFIAAGANVVNPSTTSARFESRLVQGVDLYPTILNLAGISMSSVLPSGRKVDGKSLVPYLQNNAASPVRYHAYSEYFTGAYDQSPKRAIRNWKFKYISQFGTQELYDLAADKLEQNNLIAAGKPPLNAEQSAALTELKNQMSSLLATR